MDRESAITVRVDESWADALPPCVVCGQDVPWDNALLMPLGRYDEVEGAGVIHASGCPATRERHADG